MVTHTYTCVGTLVPKPSNSKGSKSALPHWKVVYTNCAKDHGRHMAVQFTMLVRSTLMIALSSAKHLQFLIFKPNLSAAAQNTLTVTLRRGASHLHNFGWCPCRCLELLLCGQRLSPM